jgi:hypothetical protein
MFIIAGTRCSAGEVRLHYSKIRVGARLNYVEGAPGVVIVLPSWMLDPAACAGMTLGAPQVDIAGLKDLRQLLIDRGFRRSCSGDVRVAEEEQNDAFAQVRRSEKLRPTRPRQVMIAFESPQLWRMNTPERRRILACANLLMQAAGGAIEENNDDKRFPRRF